MENLNNIYQDVLIRVYKDEEEQGVKYISHHIACGAKYMDHLYEAVRLPLSSHNNRVIIIADTLSYGYQAASYLLSKSHSLVTAQPYKSVEFDYEEIDFEDFLDEIPETDETNDCYGDSGSAPFGRSKDMIIANAEIWNPETDELVPNLIPFQRQAGISGMISRACNILLYCSRRNQDCAQVMDEIENHLDHTNNFYILITSDSVNENFVERLVFEHDFFVIRIKEPTLEQLKNVFKDLAGQYKLKISKDVDVAEIIQELKNYRKTLFWEKDIEKLIIKTSEKVKGKIAVKKDFSLYYYKGQDISGETMLNKLIGQNDVKDQILRLVASFKLANALNEKYGTDTSIYKHMAFAGPPGTGKTQIARITARLFHEHGLSNGIFLEVGRNDLVAGYLGQTAMKVSKIFEKAKGGVIFIDEAGSLVLNSQDNYTKEAITTLIRFMENNPDTTVILATYPDEMERLLDSDRGFRSRIAKVIEFLPYTDDELWEIFKLMAADRHHTVEDAAKEIVLGYIEALKKAKKEEFGNAREMRKLLQTAHEEVAIRLMNGKSNSGYELITCDDIKKAVSGLKKGISKTPLPMGFTVTAKPDKRSKEVIP